MMTKNIELALQIAAKAHEGQKDKAGMPYILHPIAVSEFVENEKEKIVALLHDTIEDTDITESYLETIFDSEIVRAVECMTHRPNEDYMDYIHRISGNEIATNVKIADLKHNLCAKRVDVTSSREWIKARRKKYKKALRKLKKIRRHRQWQTFIKAMRIW